jgi:hypothetical protein
MQPLSFCLLLPIVLCGVLPTRYGITIVMAHVAAFAITAVSIQDSRGPIGILLLCMMCAAALALRAFVMVAKWFFARNELSTSQHHNAVDSRSQLLSIMAYVLQGLFIGIVVIYPQLPIGNDGFQSLAMLFALSAVLWVATWISYRASQTIGKIIACYTSGIALVPLIVGCAACWIAWQIFKEADQVANGRAYCVGVPDQAAHYRPIDSIDDLMIIGLSPFPPEYSSYHAVVLLATDGAAAWGNWSYKQGSFDFDHDNADFSIPIPRFSCSLKPHYLAGLPWL